MSLSVTRLRYPMVTSRCQTAAVLSWFMLAMVHHPEVQRKAHDELDRVVGRDRMPTFADYEHLPYIRAIVKEALR